jgi:hypothetical protein
MYAMRYGTPPLVRATGGLIDTVEQYVEGASTGTGFRFNDATASALHDTIGWVCATYYDRPQEFAALRQRGMAKDFSWRRSAERYVNVYRWAVEQRTGERLHTTTESKPGLGTVNGVQVHPRRQPSGRSSASRPVNTPRKEELHETA